MRKLAMLVAALILLSCGPQPESTPTKPMLSQPVTSQKASVSGLHLSLDPSACQEKAPNGPTNCWYEDHVLLGGQTVGGRTPIVQNAAGCPSGAFCRALPDRATNIFASYLLQIIPPVYSKTVATPVAAYLDLSGYEALKFTVRVAAPPGTQFRGDYDADNEKCPTPATVRPYFMHAVGAGQATHNNWRWWAFDPQFKKPGDVDRYAYTLAPGEATIVVPLDPQDWVDVNGQGHTGLTDPEGWKTALSAASLIGWTYGEGCTLGHGVATLKGSATIEILEYSFVPKSIQGGK